jgi:nascent polypeptide-associated complex subunit alpha
MIPGMNSKQAQQMMKKMGISQQEIEAEQVIIRCGDHNLVIDSPQVAKVNMMGQDMFQITGQARQESISQDIEISQEDVQTVMEQAQVDEDTARKAITQYNGDLAEAILSLNNESD